MVKKISFTQSTTQPQREGRKRGSIPNVCASFSVVVLLAGGLLFGEV